MIRGYRDLNVWKKAYALTLKIYEITANFPAEEKFGLVSQMRRASTSIIANIAEGYGKNHTREYIQFISISIGSCNELEVYLLLSKDLGYVIENDFHNIKQEQNEVSKMLFRLRKSLESKLLEVTDD
ncbi:MAG: four helix bundle protein [Thermoplasmata archaeon]